MLDSFQFYLLAFKNIFDYKNTAERSELNWFMLYWFILNFIVFFICAFVSTIVSAFKHFENMVFFLFIIFGIIFLFELVHMLPFASLIKRRFKKLMAQRANLPFVAWLICWLMPVLMCVFFISATVFNLKVFTPFNPILFVLLWLISSVVNLVTSGTVIYLMIKK